VIEAADGIQAIKACAGCPIDVLVCDFLLPDMTASDVVAIALKSNPKLKVLVMSGEPECSIRCAGMSDRYQVITKPFQLSDLVRMIDESR
jgi:CheY-like chemotaxis protein